MTGRSDQPGRTLETDAIRPAVEPWLPVKTDEKVGRNGHAGTVVGWRREHIMIEDIIDVNLRGEAEPFAEFVTVG